MSLQWYHRFHAIFADMYCILMPSVLPNIWDFWNKFKTSIKHLNSFKIDSVPQGTYH